MIDRSSRPDPELTTLEAVGNRWCFTLVDVEAEDIDDLALHYHLDQALLLLSAKYRGL